MAKVRIQRGEIDKSELKPRLEKALRWAVLKSTEEVVYVGDLKASQNGNACGCKCPSCGKDLQAVNADKDASHFRKANTRWKFFRHPNDNQRRGCSFMVAKLAALKLLLNSGEVDLPPPKKIANQVGISGATYTSVVAGQRWIGRIVEKQWNDKQSATITLEDGRTVLVLLQACSKISDQPGVDGVIIIQVNDPGVASWSPNEILEALKFNVDFSCWEKHWDDEVLAAQAQSKAQSLADEVMDYFSPDLGLMDGLTMSQKSETVLHAKVKEILAQAGRVLAPACSQTINLMMDDGIQRNSFVEIPSQYLNLSNVRLEKSMLDMVPDVMCTAYSSRKPQEKFTLLIEVAVTHRVDSRKKVKIEKQNLACLEIDLSQLGLQGRITLDQLRSSVVDMSDGKNWIFNPALAPMVSERKQELHRENSDLRKSRELEQERLEWLDDCSLDRLVEIFLPVLKKYWYTKKRVSLDEGFLVLPGEISERLISHGFNGAGDFLLIGENGILSFIDEIETLSQEMQPVSNRCNFWKIEQNPNLQKYITLGLLAVKAYPLNWVQAEWQFEELRKKVTDSLKREEIMFARPSTYDNLIGLLFPDMRDLLTNPFGKREPIQQLVELKANAERDRLAKIQRSSEIAQRKQMQEVERTRELNQKIHELLVSEHALKWRSEDPGSSIKSISTTTAIVRLRSKYARSGIKVDEVLKSACDARERGYSVRNWFQDQQLASTQKASMLVSLLKTAKMLS